MTKEADSQDLDRITDALGDIGEQIGDAARETARLEVRVSANSERLTKIENAVNGEGDELGLKARVSVLEDWRKSERKRATATPVAVAASDSALVKVETARAEAAKAQAEASKGAWDAAKTIVSKVGPWILALIALGSQVFQWLVKTSGEK